jgi:hypothetical protein
MKQFFATLGAVLIGGFLVLLGYDHFIVKPRAAAAADTEAAADSQSLANAQVDLDKARADAQQVAAEVEASVQRSVDSARDTMDAQAQAMDRRALVADAVQRVTMFRVALTEFHQSNGRWPQDADEAGLPSPAEMRGGAVSEVVLGERGVVTVALDERFGSGSAILLKPSANAASGIVDWVCEVKGDAELKRAMPRCKG